MNLYLDTSALVKLYLDEPGSEHVRRVSEDASVICISVLAYVEACSAFARKYRQKDLSLTQYRETIGSLNAEWDSYYIIEVDDLLIRSAAALTESSGLRALDALHLASAKVVKHTTPHLFFMTADSRLALAVVAEGLEAIDVVS
ncbi:MAG: type II toxin-antitoxin system VapC family toxin [Chloroflexi bacterium]|nr:type II toxin-antitoxin system VapC family toxin [Chloroflexota bacterium]